MYRYVDRFEEFLGHLPPVFACETLSGIAIGRATGLAEGLEDEEELEGLAYPVSRDMASGVDLREGLAGVVGRGTYQEEAVGCLVEGVEGRQEGKEDTLQVERSVVLSCHAACNGPCMADPGACSEGKGSGFLEGVVREGRAEKEEDH